MSTCRLIVALYCVTLTVNGLHRIPLSTIATPKKETLQTREGRHVYLQNQHNMSYIAEIKIGDNPQNYRVVVSTGSPNLIVFSRYCSKCGWQRRQECRNTSSYVTPLLYGSQNVIGSLCTDNVTISQLTAKNQGFTVLYFEENLLQEQETPFIDGELGLGFKESGLSCLCTTPPCDFIPYSCNYPPHTYHPETVFQNLVKQNLVQRNIFSLYLTGPDKHGSELTLGGSDPHHYSGNLTYAHIPNYHYQWIVPMEGLFIGEEDAGFCGLSTCFALVDSAVPFIAIPEARVFIIEAILSQKVDIERIPIIGSEQTIFRVPINAGNEKNIISRFESIFITIAGQKFEITPSDYLFLDGNYYYVGLYTWSKDSWGLGGTFLRKVYTQFDMEKRRIGFAPAK